MMNSIIQPNTLKALSEGLAQEGRALIVAGGTDLLVRLKANPVRQRRVIDLSHMTPLKEYSLNEMGLRIGSMCTMTELNESSVIRKAAPALANAAGQVGSTQIRNRATIGGNVANAAQCADTVPALIALDADVELMNSEGAIRSIKVEDFIIGIGKTLITEQEVLTGFFIPSRLLNHYGGYSKIGSRKTVTIAKVNCAGVFCVEDERIAYARIAFGSLGQRGFYSESVSEAFGGIKLDELSVEQVLEAFVGQVERSIPGRDSLAYKRSAVKAVAASIVEQLIMQYRGC